MFVPACAVVGPVLVVVTSATSVSAVTTLALEEDPLLSEGVGSPVLDVLETTLVRLPLAGAVIVTVKLVEAALARLIDGKVTTPLPYDPPPLALTNVAPAGNVSLTTTAEAVDGPLFVTVIV